MPSGPIPQASAYYSARVVEFLNEGITEVLGKLVASNEFDLETDQKIAWTTEIGLLKQALAGIEGRIFLEFSITRLGSRVDAVLVSGPAVFPIEFKCGEHQFHSAHYNQAWDYALDLKNFHKASHDAPILPILVATESQRSDDTWQRRHSDGVYPPRRCGPDTLGLAFREGLSAVSGQAINAEQWGASSYHPTPTIIEAARALYSRHSVDAISRNDAGARNLRETSRSIDEVIERSQSLGEKSIVFVTGVPGAGKTLVGLNIATKRRKLTDSRAVYLSGNGPLVSVLQEALIRDEFQRSHERKGVIRQRVKPFIQNVHHFRDDGLRDPAAPDDHVVIFDEAQRAWDRRKTSDFMKRRKKRPDFEQSESEFLISYLDRHPEWAVVVCLVGGGQEIHTGEAGISAWLDSVAARFPAWRTYVSSNLRANEYSSGAVLDLIADQGRLTCDDRLHLSTSMRSFRAENVSDFVKAVLDCELDRGRDLLQQISGRYPIALTRDLTRAKEWVRSHARGSERYGLVASSQAQRLKPHAIDVRVNVDPVHWFLNDRNDTRSSYYLEDAATEFQVQGLELDWVCVTWDADLRLNGRRWKYHSFRGDQWTTIHKDDRQRYLLNAYRVLLTRARQGMVLFVPPGDGSDETRLPQFYDQTFEYLSRLGIPEV